MALSAKKVADPCAKANFAQMATSGIVRRSNGPWSSPYVVTKKDGSFRMCGDYRRLNTVTTPDRYSIPLIADLTARLHGRKVFGKVDLIKGNHQIPVADNNIAKTAITTLFGTFEFLRMPFGLKNGGQTFQRMMDEILSDLDYLFVYMDDVLVASRFMEEHTEHFRKLFRRLAAHDLVVSPGKCQFGQMRIEFLGHTATKDGVKPLPEKVAAISEYLAPATQDALRRFLGMFNFYNRFILNAARIMKTLYKATAKAKKQLEWSEDMTNAFNEAKAGLARATILQHTRPGAEIAMSADASGEEVGAVLQQCTREGGAQEPLAYFSKKLCPPEMKYSAFDRELLAVYLGIRHFRNYLEGRDFPIFTDHGPLTFAMAKSSEPWSHRQARHLEYISQYSTDIRYVAGADNAVADALSRVAMEEVRLGIDFSKMAVLRQQDPETTAYRTAITALKWKEIDVDGGRHKLLCDTSTGSPRPLVPAGMRRQVFDVVHGLSHPGTSATIAQSNGPWSSPLHVVTKKDGSFRMCGDYRRLNTVTTPDRYSIPLIADLTTWLHGRKVFGKVNLIKGNHQIPVADNDIAKTAITTLFGTFEFLRMPFGLKNGGQTFQRVMDEILSDLDYLFIYMDDVLVASRFMEEHTEHFRKLFRRLAAHDLVVSPGKCQFGQMRIEFLGHTVTKDGMKPLPEKVAAISEYLAPATQDALRRFLGMFNFYNGFILNAARIMKPLYKATAKAKKQLEWSEDMTNAFNEAKAGLARATILQHPRPGAEIAMSADASGEEVGAVLQQCTREGGAQEPLAYFSKKLCPPEMKYSAFDREFITVYLGIRHFRHYLEGRDFPIFTDHRPLTFAMAKSSEPWSHRQARHLEYISQYSTDIRYVAGADNAVADALSRAAMEEVRLGVDFSKMAVLRQQDPETTAYRTAITALKWEEIDVDGGRHKLLCDTSTGSPRPLVPAGMPRQVFDVVHGLSHPGTSATVRIMKSRFVWHGIVKDVRAWARGCIGYQTAKVHRHNMAPLHKFGRATARLPMCTSTWWARGRLQKCTRTC